MRSAAILLIVVGLALGVFGNSVENSEGQFALSGGILVFCGVILLLLSVFMASRREAILKVTEQYEELRGPDGEMLPEGDLADDPDRMLRALGSLRDKGIISEAQYEEQRRKLFSDGQTAK
ncbi:MAG: SHOCT domain-containing protein [Solirubrobacterales bacterium]